MTRYIKSTAEAPAKIDEDLVFDSLLFFWAGSRKLSFIPKWSVWFDSFAAPRLKDTPDEVIPLREDLVKRRWSLRSPQRCGIMLRKRKGVGDRQPSRIRDTVVNKIKILLT